MKKENIIYTIGHSTRTFKEFVEILKKFSITLLIDVRKFPTSKRFPWFNKEFLEKNLEKFGIKYFHFKELGGFRKEGYKTFSESDEFKKYILEILKLCKNEICCIMCAERYFWRCHRKFIAQKISEIGIKVIHILDKFSIYEHKPSKDLEFKMNIKIFCDKVKK